MKHSIFIFLVSSFIFPAALSASAETLVGSLPGEATVDNTGKANYTISLTVPPGTAGMQPELAIAYNSRNENGQLGIGFSLEGLSAIIRAPADRIHDGLIDGIDFDEYDRFLLDGQRLILISTDKVYGEDGSEYRTEIDSFRRVILHGDMNRAGSWFEVKTKSGLTREYGRTDDAFVEPADRTAAISWAVSRTTDTVGNYMDFIYFKDKANGEHRIERMEYTGNSRVNPALSPYNTIEFIYEDRPDSRFRYVYGARYNTVKRLKRIEFSVEGSPAHTYVLEYDSNEVGASLLSSVQETFPDGDAVPPTLFRWTQKAPGDRFVANEASPWFDPFSRESGREVSRFIDMNGDGRLDYVCLKEIGNPNSVREPHFDGIIYNDPDALYGWRLSTDYCFEDTIGGRFDWLEARFDDLNGDGFTDIYYRELYRNYLQTEQAAAFINLHDNTWTTNNNWLPPIWIKRYADRVKDLDLNGDGLTDLIRNNPSYALPGSLIFNPQGVTNAYINTGTGWVADETKKPPFIVYPAADYIDLNGDGLTDMLYRTDDYGAFLGDRSWILGTNAYLNTENGWVEYPAYEPPYPIFRALTDARGTDCGARLIDVNGDGLPDFLYHRIVYKEDNLNTETGLWGSNVTQKTGHYQVDQGAYLNTGTGWCPDVAYIPPVPLKNGEDEYIKGADFVDLNGDGLVDLAWRIENDSSPEGAGAYLNTGSGWQWSPDDAPVKPTISAGYLHYPYSCYYPYSCFADVNADGLVDQAWAEDANSCTYTNATGKAGLLKQVITGYRGANEYSSSTEFFYKPLTDPDIYEKGSGAEYPVKDYAGTMYVVSEMAKDNGYGDRYYTMYTYAHARTHQYRGFLGFQIFESYDPQTQLSQVETLAQDFPLTGLQLKTETFYISDPEADPESPGCRELLKQVDNTWLYDKVDVGNTSLDYPLFYYVAQSTEKQWELGNPDAPYSTVTTYNWFDNQDTTADSPRLTQPLENFPSEIRYGEIRKIVVDYGDGHKQITSNGYYAVDENDWLLGRLKDTAVTHVHSNGTKIVKTAHFDYIASTGLPAVEIAEEGTSSELRTDYAYDGFGNITNKVVSGYEAAPRSVQRSVYESIGRFVTESYNALGHRETLVTDPVTGQVTSHTDANSLITERELDPLGRVTLEKRPDGTQTTTMYAWENGPVFTMPSSPVTNVVDWSVTVQSSGSPPVKVCYDRKGREVRTVTESADGRTVYKDTGYDAVGRVVVTSDPYFAGDTPHHAFTTYDALSRPKLITAFDGTKTAYGYGGLVSSVTNNFGAADGPVASRNQHTTTWRNARGQTIRVVDTLGSGILYEYDAVGNLVRTTDPAGNVTEMEYDLRGNKIRQNDPDMGAWHYTYNALDQLISQTDANGNVIRTAYDLLGRPAARTNRVMTAAGPKLESTAQWFYDGASDGDKLGRLRLEEHRGSAGKLINRKRYTYDQYSRPMFELMNYDGRWYYTCVTYDEFSRPKSVYRYWRPKSKEGPEHTRSPDWNSFVSINTYNERGVVTRVTDGSGRVWWKAAAADYDAQGRLTQYEYGNGLVTATDYHPLTGRIEGIRIADRSQLPVDSYQFGYDRLGNLTSRSRARPLMTTWTESCTYDALNRLLSATLTGAANLTASASYDALGNITSRGDITDYLYGSSRPHAVTSVSTSSTNSTALTYFYDANGNIVRRDRGRDYEFTARWTSFNKPQSLFSGEKGSEFEYSVDGRRTKQIIFEDSTRVVKKVYATPAYEIRETLLNPAEANRANWQWETDFVRIYVDTPAGKIGIYQEIPVGSSASNLRTVSRSYIHKDHLGSVIAVSGEQGAESLEFYSYDAWGNRRNAADGSAASTFNASTLSTDRGYTGHEMLDHLDLIHMNGRIYDPAIGRMISPDPFIQAPDNLQSYNRYSYVWNNPLSKTDPSGFMADDDDKKITHTSQSMESTSISSDNLSEQNRVDAQTSSPQTASLMHHSDQAGNVTSYSETAGSSDAKDKESSRPGEQVDHGKTASDASVPQAPVVQNANNLKSEAELLREDASIVDKHVYGNGKVTLPSYIAQVTDKQLQKMGLDPASFQRNNGMAAGLYYNSRIEKYMLAYRGTEGLTAIKDWYANISQSMGFKTGQYSDAMKLALDVNLKTKGNFTITGHSLGGGLASAASRATGIDAITFNAAGLNSRTVSREYGAGHSSSIQSYVTHGEILNTVQDWTPLPDSVGARTWQDADHWYSLPVARHGQF